MWLYVYLLPRECYELTLEIREKLHGHKHPSVGTVLTNLGNLWRIKGDKAKAISHFQEALAIQEQILGPNDLQVSNYSVIGILILQYQEFITIRVCNSHIVSTPPSGWDDIAICSEYA